MLELLAWPTTPAGNGLQLIIQLVVLQVMGMLAVGRWRAQQRAGAAGPARAWARLAVTAWALFAMRLLLLGAGLVVPAGSVEASWLLGPLERANALLTAGLLARALAAPELPSRGEWQLGVLVAGAALGLVLTWQTGLGSATRDNGFFNGSASDSAWAVATLAVLAWAMWRLAGQRVPGRLPGLGLLALLGLAHLAHYRFPLGGTGAPAAVRWGEAVAVPAGMLLLYLRARAWPPGRPALAPAPPDASGPPAGRLLRDAALTLVVAILAYGAIDFSLGRYRVEGQSMQPGLHPGQFVVVDRLAYALSEPARGEVVVVQVTEPGQIERSLIKRIIGLPGETVTVEGSQLRINGRLYAEPYPREPGTYFGTWVLGPGEYFVLGDNRDVSRDSHVWGPVRRAAIRGQAMLVYWPPGEWALINHAPPRP